MDKRASRRQMPFEAITTVRFPRRALLGLPVVAGVAAALYPRERALPDGAQPGNGPEVRLAFFSRSGTLEDAAVIRSLIHSDAEWRRDLTASEFAVTRRQATEFAFANRYWNCHDSGMYRCVCCGNALFRSQDKFDSGTGWPAFSGPCAQSNIRTQVDKSYRMERTEVLCRKCNAHLGHVFDDGPPPSGLRYCINSTALRLVGYA